MGSLNTKTREYHKIQTIGTGTININKDNTNINNDKINIRRHIECSRPFFRPDIIRTFYINVDLYELTQTKSIDFIVSCECVDHHSELFSIYLKLNDEYDVNSKFKIVIGTNAYDIDAIGSGIRNLNTFQTSISTHKRDDTLLHVQYIIGESWIKYIQEHGNDFGFVTFNFQWAGTEHIKIQRKYIYDSIISSACHRVDSSPVCFLANEFKQIPQEKDCKDGRIWMQNYKLSPSIKLERLLQENKNDGKNNVKNSDGIVGQIGQVININNIDNDKIDNDKAISDIIASCPSPPNKKFADDILPIVPIAQAYPII